MRRSETMEEMSLSTVFLSPARPEPRPKTAPGHQNSNMVTRASEHGVAVKNGALSQRGAVPTSNAGLVSCLRNVGHNRQTRRNRSVRFVCSTRGSLQTPALEEGSMLVGRTPPASKDPSRGTPRATAIICRHQDDAQLGPPETPPPPPPSPPLVVAPTMSATPRGVAPRCLTAPGPKTVAVARVQVRGDLYTSVIGEVYRENKLRYSDEYLGQIVNPEPSSTVTASVTNSNTTASINTSAGMHGSVSARGTQPAKEGNKQDQPKTGPTVTEAVQVLNVAPRPRVRLLGDRQNIRVTYSQNQVTQGPTHSAGHTVALTVNANSGSNKGGVSTQMGGVSPGEGSRGLGSGTGYRTQEAGGPSAPRMTARVVIRRRRAGSLQEKPDSDSDSVDRIDISHHPHSGVRRAMSLRAPARQVWTPDQAAPSGNGTPRGDGATGPAVRTSVRRSISLRILPRRTQQQTSGMSVTSEQSVEGRTVNGALVEKPRPHVRMSTSSIPDSKPSPERVVESVTSAGTSGKSDLLSSCMGGLGQSSAKWIAEQNRKRALKSLEPATHFSGVPTSHPLTVCFDYEGTGLSHRTVLDATERTIQRYQNARVTKIQFVAKSIVLSSMWVPNRWVVTVSTQSAQQALIVSGVSIFGKDVKCRLYDDVLAEEYKRFLEKEERTAE